jgi:hypothetical protein
MYLKGVTRLRQREIVETATREATDVISVKQVNAEKADTFEIGTFSFTGNTVKGKVAVAA